MIRGILLAGGASTRYGAPKLLQRLPDGATIGEQSARRLIQGVQNALAVVRPGDEALVRIFADAGCEVLITERALEGMGSSLSAAISASRDATGWVIALADMPYIAADTSAAVRSALAEGASIAVPTWSGEQGHPVGFAALYGAELAALSGDDGARVLLLRHAASTSEIAVADANIRKDIDVPNDLQS